MKNHNNNSLDLSILILARNELLHIERCIQSAQQLGVQIFVIDSHSTDGTPDIAKAMGACVIQYSANCFADKLNWALSNVEFPTTWVMRLDADEVLSDKLIKVLPVIIHQLPEEVCGLMLRRQLWFMGRWMRHGGVYPTWTMRIWRRNTAICESRNLDEHMLLLKGTARTLQLDVIDNPCISLTAWIDKHNRYSNIEAEVFLHQSDKEQLRPLFFGSPVERVRWIKLNVFYRLSPFIRPVLYFIYRYIFRLGFLDGHKGFIFHFLHALWYRIVVDAKIFEQRERELKDEVYE